MYDTCLVNCVTISVVKTLLNRLLRKVLVADDHTDLTKEMKERVKADLELRYVLGFRV